MINDLHHSQWPVTIPQVIYLLVCEVATESFYIGTFGSQIHVITKTLKLKPKLWGDLLALVILVFQFNLSTGLAHNDVTTHDGIKCVFKWYITCEVKTV